LAVYLIEKVAPSPLFALLFDHSPAVIGFTLDRFLRGGTHTPQASLEIVEFALLRFEERDSLPLRLIARFFVERLKSGGLELLATVILKRKSIAIALLREQVAKAIFVLALNDLPNTKTFLQLIQLIVSVIGDEPIGLAFSKAVFRCAVLTMIRHGRDPQHGPAVVAMAAQLLNDCRLLLQADFASVFQRLSQADQTAACEILHTHIGKAALRKRNANLTTFSDGQRMKKSFDEWQTLEIEE
jgi:hypothetical protein